MAGNRHYEPHADVACRTECGFVVFSQCQNCTFINDIRQTTCQMCELGWSGRRECPQGKWMCAVEDGGCSFFNPTSQFYCEMCNRARPDLSSVRF